MRRSSAVLFLAAVLLMLDASPAVAQSVDTLFARAVRTYAQGDYSNTVLLLEEITRRDRRHAEAQYLLARLYLEPAPYDLDRSKDAIKHALKEDGDNPDYLAVRLRHRRADPTAFLPPLQRERRRRLANKILRRDSTNAVALTELGSQQTNLFLLYDGAITLKARTAACANRFDIACYQAGGAATIDRSGEAEEAYAEGIDYLRHALANDPDFHPAYAPLLKLYAARNAHADALALLDTMRAHFPHNADAWLYTGWARYRAGRFAEAAAAFDTALPLLDDDDRAVFEDLHFILHEDEEKPYEQDPNTYAARYWAEQDPRLLTAYNERRLEHYARLVHADLRYAAPNVGRRGWETAPGRIFLRYGAPQRRYLLRGTRFYTSDGRGAFDASRRTGTFLIWEYDAFRFVFEDPESTMNNWYRLYSPSALEYGRSTLPVVEDNDYVIKAREVARKEPERSHYAPPGGRKPLPFLASVFKGTDGRADLYVPFGLPDDLDADTATTGLFLRADADLRVVAEQRGETPVAHDAPTVDVGTLAVHPHLAQMQAPPGTYELAVEFEAAHERGAGYERTAVTIPDFSTGGPMVSDVLPALLVEETETGARLAPAQFTRGGYAVTPAPGNTFDRAQPLYLFFETYGLARGAEGTTAYALEAVLVPWGDDPKGLQKLLRNAFGRNDEREGVSVRFEGTGTTLDEAHYLILDVQDQPAGRYVLGLRVHDRVREATVETSREIVLE